jgi:hypothetical protein
VRIEPIVPDVPPALGDGGGAGNRSAGEFSRALDALANALGGATRAEDDFAAGAGTLETAAYERARADVALSVATAAAARASQAVQSILNMQV